MKLVVGSELVVVLAIRRGDHVLTPRAARGEVVPVLPPGEVGATAGVVPAVVLHPAEAVEAGVAAAGALLEVELGVD